MGLNDTPAGERVQIAFFGCRNVGKSSIVNAITGQDLAVVSPTKGTTTDPVSKNMELLPLGPVTIVDTPGFDDEGDLGSKRVAKTRQVLNRCDIAVLVTDATRDPLPLEEEFLALLEAKRIPHLVVVNKTDLVPAGLSSSGLASLLRRSVRSARSGEAKASSDSHPSAPPRSDAPDDEIRPDEAVVFASALTGDGIEECKERIARLSSTDEMAPVLVRDLLAPEDVVVLVTPIDESAPKGRMILPQQQMIRDVLEADAINIVTKETQLSAALAALGKAPRMVITDSQAFGIVSKIVPEEIPLTSFSILLARYKGFLETAVRGAAKLDHLQDGDKVLISEGCTHHRQCKDIGTVKLPNWLSSYTGKKLEFFWTSGGEFPDDLTDYALVCHCGGCMVNGREMRYRMNTAIDQGIPFTNYGIAIAHVNGILRRSLSLFPELQALLG